MTTPSTHELPDIKSSFHEVSGFLTQYDQVPYFKELWGADYYKNIELSWTRQIELFKANKNPECSWRELILVMTFDYYLGPYVGLPEKIKTEFYNTIIGEIRTQLLDGNLTV